MRYLLIILIFLEATISGFSQDYKSVYYNSKWEITSKKYATYFRNSGFKNEEIVFDSTVSDFYMSGILEMKGYYKNGLKNGAFIYYYPNGNIFLKTMYNNNNREGTWIEFYTDGKVKKEVKYENNKEKLIQYNDSLGESILKKGTCKYKINYSLNYEHNPDKELYSFLITSNSFVENLRLFGKIQDGLKNGTWRIYQNHKLFSDVYYKKGVFIKGFVMIDTIESPISSDIHMTLFFEPQKIYTTENFFCEPGQMISNNYVVEALQKYSNKRIKKRKVFDKQGLIDFFNSEFSIHYKDCKDTCTINLRLNTNNLGKVKIISITPKVSNSIQNEIYRIINKASNLDQDYKSEIQFNYRITCIDELQYKK